MAVPLLFFAAGTLLRAAGPRIAAQLVKAGAKEATKKQIAKGGAKVVNNNNLGVIRTALRPKSGGAAPKPTAPKAKTSSGSGSAPKTTPKKPAGSGGAKKAPTKKKPPAKKKAPAKNDIKPNAKDAPPSVQARLAKKNKPTSGAAKKQSPFGSRTQRALLLAATTAPALFPSGNGKDTAKAGSAPDYSNRSNSKGGRGRGEGVPPKKTDGESFGAAFARARKKGVGTKFTFKGNQYAAVRDSDIPSSIKGTKKERLQKFLNQRKQKGKK